jgi:ATPase family associated with various cellular activities (AAA)
MTTTAARTPVEPAIEAFGAEPDERDERLLAWRDVLVGAATAALRTYRSAWSADHLDDAARATAGVGALDGQSAPDPSLHVGGMVPGVGPSAAGRVRPRTFHDVLPAGGALAATVTAAGLTPGEEALLAAAWWTAVDPQLAVAFGCLHDDSRRRWATPATVRLALTRLGVDVPVVVGEDSSLVRPGLLDPAPGPGHPLTLTAAAADLLSGNVRALPATTETATRLAPVADRLADLVAGGGRVVARCVADDDRASLRDAVAERLALPLAPTSRPPGLADLLFRLRRELPAVVLGGGETPPEGCVLALGPSDASAPPGWHTVDVPAPTLTQAAAAWRSALRTAGARVGRANLAAYASRIPLGEKGIREVVARAAAAAEARGDRLTGDDVAAALRGQPRHDPGGLARQVPTATRLDDLVLSAATRDGLDEVVAHARWSAAAHETLGFDGVRGRAVVALFHGPSGTGKTAAAEALAAAVDRDLWVVDLAKVVSKWLGETQRNLDTVLDEAATAGVVLLFDEADGLFGKRGEVTDARDRYANLEIDHLLQRIELHTGVVVLTSNRPAALDEAFARRIRLSVRFDLPDHAEREELWRRVLPVRLLGADTDTVRVAREELSGAAIRAAALAATVLATADGSAVTSAHLETAVRRELEKIGRHLTARTVRS